MGYHRRSLRTWPRTTNKGTGSRPNINTCPGTQKPKKFTRGKLSIKLLLKTAHQICTWRFFERFLIAGLQHPEGKLEMSQHPGDPCRTVLTVSETTETVPSRKGREED